MSTTTQIQRTNGLGGYSTPFQGWKMSMLPGEPIVFEHPSFGTLAVGIHPSGKFDQWIFHEINGGGVLVVPYFWKDSAMHVVLLRSNRFNLSNGEGNDIEVIGGFHDGNEIAIGGALKECLEEAGMLPDDLEAESGRYYTSNRAFFQLDGDHEGTKVFSWEVTPEQMAHINNDDRLTTMRWEDAVQECRDSLSIAAIARVASHKR